MERSQAGRSEGEKGLSRVEDSPAGSGHSDVYSQATSTKEMLFKAFQLDVDRVQIDGGI